MIAMIQSEHRALGRDIARSQGASLDPAFAGTPSLILQTTGRLHRRPSLPSVQRLPWEQAAGYLKPTVTIDLDLPEAYVTSATYASVYANVLYKAPSIAM